MITTCSVRQATEIFTCPTKLPALGSRAVLIVIPLTTYSNMQHNPVALGDFRRGYVSLQNYVLANCSNSKPFLFSHDTLAHYHASPYQVW